LHLFHCLLFQNKPSAWSASAGQPALRAVLKQQISSQVIDYASRDKGEKSDLVLSLKRDLECILTISSRPDPDIPLLTNVLRQFIVVHTRYHEDDGKTVSDTMSKLVALDKYPSDVASMIFLARSLNLDKSSSSRVPRGGSSGSDTSELQRRKQQSARDKAKHKAQVVSQKDKSGIDKGKGGAGGPVSG